MARRGVTIAVRAKEATETGAGSTQNSASATATVEPLPRSNKYVACLTGHPTTHVCTCLHAGSFHAASPVARPPLHASTPPRLPQVQFHNTSAVCCVCACCHQAAISTQTGGVAHDSNAVLRPLVLPWAANETRVSLLRSSTDKPFYALCG